jgi:molecular chaperone HtpG
MVVSDEVINSRQAIWLREPSEISDDEYNSFFSHLNHFDSKPLRRIHFTAEGTSEFKALLFIPATAPMDLFFPEKKTNLHLYVRRVFITDNCPALLPGYLRFMKGVVDSSDLPLNISREMLQDNPKLDKINKALVRKLIAELKKIMDNEPEQYAAFFKEFGRVLKEGVHMDFANRDKLRELLMFETMNHEAGKLVSLKEYAAAMPEGQKEIYFLIGEDRAALENSPHLELFRSKGFDVLFMSDPIDEWVMQSVRDFEGKHLKAIGKGEIELDGDDDKALKEKTEQATAENKDLLAALKKALEGRAKDVRFSKRLTESACCLVGGEYEPSPYMQRVYKSMNHETPTVRRVLELNPSHPIIEALRGLHGKSPDSPVIAEYAELLFDQALLAEGSPVPDPLNFAKRVAKLMVAGLSGQSV